MAKYGKAASKSVKNAVKEMKAGKLTSGTSGKKVTSRKQAIAIGLSEAREKGAKVPTKKAAAKKTTAVKSAAKKAIAKKSTSSKKTTVKKIATKKQVSKKSSSKKVIGRDTAPVTKKTTHKKAGKQIVDDIKMPIPESHETGQMQREHLDFLPEKFKANPHDSYHGSMEASKSKSKVKPSGKKPLWSNTQK